MATFMSEISRLKLSNQQMTISTVVLDRISIQSERGIGLGLSSCRREGVVPGPKDSKNNNKISQFYQFFDTSCVWSHLHPFDEKNVLENKFKLDKKIAKQTQHVVSYILSDSNFISVFSFFCYIYFMFLFHNYLLFLILYLIFLLFSTFKFLFYRIHFVF